MIWLIIRIVLIIIVLNVAARFLEGLSVPKDDVVMELAEKSAKKEEPLVKGEPAMKSSKKKSEPENPLDAYRAAVRAFSRYCAEVTRMTDIKKEGGFVEKRRLVYAASMAKSYREDLMRYKKELGFDEDLLAFNMDQKFAGFELKRGRLIFSEGTKSVEGVASKWVSGFPEKYDNFHFEIACFLKALDEPLTDDYYPKEWQKEWREGKFGEAA